MWVIRGLMVAVVSATLGLSFASPAAAYDDIQVTLTGPDSVSGGETITLRGSVTRNGATVDDGEVSISYRCVDPFDHFAPAGTSRTASNGKFSFEFEAGPCSDYVFRARYDEVATDSWSYADFEVAVDRTPMFLRLEDDDVPCNPYTFEEVDFTAYLSLADGTPLPNAVLRVARHSDEGGDAFWTVTTGADGSVLIHDTPGVEGQYGYTAYFPGTDTLDDGDSTNALTCFTERRPAAVTLSAPSTASLDEPVEVTGTLTGPPPPAAVTVTGPGGQKTTVSTDTDGMFRATVTGSVGGTGNWAARYAGDDLYYPAVAFVTVTIPKFPTEMEVTGPDNPSVGDLITLSGHLVGVDAPAVVTYNGFSELHTDADGFFEATVRYSTAGDRTATFEYEGDERHASSSDSLTLHVVAPEGPQPPDPPPSTPALISLTVKADPSDPWGRVALTCVTVSGDHLPYSVWAVDRLGHRYPMARDENDSDCFGGQFPRLVHITATAPADENHVGASATATFKPGTFAYSRPMHPSRHKHRYWIYRHGADPLIASWLDAPQPGSCLRHQVQRRIAHHWRTVKRSTCKVQDTAGSSRWRMRGTHPPGAKYRIRALFAGNVDAYGTHGRWTYIRFR